MKWSLRIANLAGIGIYVHWTFLLFMAWIGLGNLINGGSVEALRDLGLMLMIFSFIVLHEMGHALTARRFGIKTRDITLLPIGGVARLERMPDDPREEFLVAIAGPAVNVVLAIIAAGLMVFIRGSSSLFETDLIGTDFLTTGLYLNLGLAAFNLLPAFPMDGGRILRALLVRRQGYVVATETAASIGQFLAIGLGILGLFTNGMLMFVALFVYLGAQQEALQVQLKSILGGVPVREAMRTHFMSLLRDDDVGVALKEFLAGNQHDFPVLDENQSLCGMVYREDILSKLDDDPATILIDKVMRSDCGSVPVSSMLENALNVMHERNCSVLPVTRFGRVMGLISLENIGAFMMIQSAKSGKRTRSCVTPFCQPTGNRVPLPIRETTHVESTPFA